MLKTLSLTTLAFIIAVAVTACTPKSSTPDAQAEHAQGGSFAASISNSGQLALVSTLYHGVALWDLNKNGLKYIWQQTPKGSELTFNDGDTTASMASTNFVFATAIAHDDSHAVLADKQSFSLWDTESGQNKGFWQVKKSKVKLLQDAKESWLNPKDRGQTNLTNGQYEVIDANGCNETALKPDEACQALGRIRAIDVSNNGNHILIGKSNGVAVHLSVNSGRRLEFLGHLSALVDENGELLHLNNAINSVALSPNGRYALTGSSDQSAYLWDTKSGQVLHKFRHGARVVQVALDPKARFAFTADSKGSAKIWDLKSGGIVSSLKYINRQEVFTTARFSDNGKYLVTGAPNRELSLWRVATGELKQKWYVTPRKDTRPASAVVYSAAFINNDQQIISESSAGLSEIWSINP